METFITSFFVDASALKSFGNSILLVGLAGDILVLFISAKRHKLEKTLAVVFILIIIGGIALERIADSWAEPRSLSVPQQAELRSKLSAFPKTNSFILASTAAE